MFCFVLFLHENKTSDFRLFPRFFLCRNHSPRKKTSTVGISEDGVGEKGSACHFDVGVGLPDPHVNRGGP